MRVEWSFWPQYDRYVITRTRKVRLGEDEVVTIVMTPAQARKFARQVLKEGK